MCDCHGAHTCGICRTHADALPGVMCPLCARRFVKLTAMISSPFMTIVGIVYRYEWLCFDCGQLFADTPTSVAANS